MEYQLLPWIPEPEPPGYDDAEYVWSVDVPGGMHFKCLFEPGFVRRAMNGEIKFNESDDSSELTETSEISNNQSE